MQETPVDSWVGKIPWRRDRILTPVFLDFPGGSDGKESACNAGDLGLIPGLGRTPGGGQGNPLQYSCLENPNGQRSLAGYSRRGCKEVSSHMLLICPSLPAFPHVVTINLFSIPVSVLQMGSLA